MPRNMKAPVCEFCLRMLQYEEIRSRKDLLKMLCMADREKLIRGEIDEKTIEVSKVLYTLEHEFKSLRDIELLEVKDYDDVLVLVVKRGQAASILNDRNLIYTLKKRLQKKRIFVVGKPASTREIVRSLIYPAQLISLTIVFIPDGTSVRRVLLSEWDYKKLYRLIPILERIAKDLTGEEIEIKPASNA